jgi:hypothetical protein
MKAHFEAPLFVKSRQGATAASPAFDGRGRACLR